MPAFTDTRDVVNFMNDHWIPDNVSCQIGDTCQLLKHLAGQGKTDADSGVRRSKPSGEMLVGGARVKSTLRTARNTARGSYKGFDTLKTTRNDKYSTVYFDLQNYYGTLIESLDETLELRGEEQVVDKLEADIKGIHADLWHDMGVGVYNLASDRGGGISSTQNKGFYGVRELTLTDREWGSIDSTDYEYWDPGYYNTDGATRDQLMDPSHDKFIGKILRNMTNATKWADSRLTHIYVDETIFGIIEDLIWGKKLGGMMTESAELGIMTAKYRGAEIIPESSEYFTDGEIIGISDIKRQGKKVIRLVGRRDAWFKLSNTREPINQMSSVRFLIAHGALIALEPRLFGRVTGLAV
jgi:hypothetical protein